MKTNLMLRYYVIVIVLHLSYSSASQSRYEKLNKVFYKIINYKNAKTQFRKLLAGSLAVETLNSTELSDLYWYLKQDCYYLRKKEGSKYNLDGIYYSRNATTLIEFAKTCLKNGQADAALKLEVLEFLEQQKQKPILLSNSPSYIVLKYEQDIKYNYFLENRKDLTVLEINSLISLFEKENYFEQDIEDIGINANIGNKKNYQIGKLSTLQLEKLKRDSSLNNLIKFQSFMEMMPINAFHLFLDLNNKDVEDVFEMRLSNHDIVIKFADILIAKNEYQKSVNYLNKSEQTPQVKFRIFKCKIQLQGMVSALDYLMAQKPKAKNWNAIMAESTFNLPAEGRIELLKHLYTNYKKALDSLDFAIIFGLRYINICQFILCEGDNPDPIYVIAGDKVLDVERLDSKSLEENYQFLLKISDAYGFSDEIEYFKKTYWKHRIYSESTVLGCGPWCFEVIDKYVKQGFVSKQFGSKLIYDQAALILDGLSGRGIRGTSEFEAPYKKIISLCNKSLQMDPNNALNYKLLGDVYSFLGDGNKNQYYYKLAANKGVYMNDRQTPGTGKSSLKTGPRGGKYFINNNGYKTYVSQ